MLSVELDFKRGTSLFYFKTLVAAKEGVRREQVHLTIGGKEYPDEKKLMLVAHLDFVMKLKVMLVLLLTPPHVVSCTIYLNCICTLLHDGVCLQDHFA